MSALRRNRTDNLRLSSMTVSVAPETPTDSSSASWKCRGTPCVRNSLNAAPLVINSTARSQRSLGTGALASATASVAADATPPAIRTASFTRPPLFSLSESARCASSLAQHAGSASVLTFRLHGHGPHAHAQRSFSCPGNAC